MGSEHLRPDNEWWTNQLRDMLPSASEWVVVPARHGSWLRNFVPSLGPRLIAVRGEEVVVFSQNIARTRARREVWRGLRSDLDVRSYFLDHLLRIRGHGPTLRLQVDGSLDVDRILRKLDRI
jgi:hypothetical protein